MIFDLPKSQKFFFIQTTNPHIFTSPQPPTKKKTTNQNLAISVFWCSHDGKKTHVPRHPDVSIRGPEARGGRRERENDMYRSRKEKNRLELGDWFIEDLSFFVM